MSLRAMILAAGEGKRLRPHTLKTPKPLIPVAGKSMMERWLNRLAHMHINHVVVNCCHLSHQFALIHKLAAPGQEVTLIVEPQALDTGGAVRNALELLGTTPFFVISADVWFNLDEHQWLERLKAFQSTQQLIHLGLTPSKADYKGDFQLLNGQVITPPGPKPYQYAGFCVAKPAAFTGLEQGHPMGLGSLITDLVHQEKVSAEIIAGPHWDMGTPLGFDAMEQSLLADVSSC